MGREILFRGKNPDNGKWYEGVYSPYNWDFFGMKSEIPQIIILSEDKYLDGKWIEVIPETVGQYTGLKDKNGKRIFEGGIIQSVETGEIGIVQWFPEHSAFMVWCRSSNEIGFLYECSSIVEVIGNVHDNPGLLKGE